jgi:transposase-like protein
MGTSNSSDGLRRDTVQLVRVRGYPLQEVPRRLGVNSHSLCEWMKHSRIRLAGRPAWITTQRTDD